MAGRKMTVYLVGNATGLQRAYTEAATGAQAFGSKMESAGKRVSSVGKRIAIFGGVVLGVAGYMGKKFVDAAMAAQTEMGALDVAARNQGMSLAKVSTWVDTLSKNMRQLGFSNSDTRQAATAFVRAGEKQTQATKDMALAADLARAKDVDLGTAATALVKAHQGLLRPLKELGISLPSATDHMKALTDAHKKAGTAITYNEKALAFQQDKLETGTKAMELMRQKLHGTAAEFSQTAAGGMQTFRAQLGALEESIGKFLLPIVKQLTDFVSGLAQRFNDLSPHTKKIVALAIAGAVAFGGLAVVLGGVMVAVGPLIAGIGMLASPVGLVILGIVALSAAFTALMIKSPKFRAEVIGAAQGIATFFKQDLLPAIRTTISIISQLWDKFGSDLTRIMRSQLGQTLLVLTTVLKTMAGTVRIFSDLLHGNWRGAWGALKSIAKAQWDLVLGTFRNFVSNLKAVGSMAVTAVVSMATGISHAVASLATSVYTAAVRIGEAIIHGIEQGFMSLVGGLIGKMKSAVSGAVSSLAGHLGIHSPSQVMADQIGAPLAQGVIAGWITGISPLEMSMTGKLSSAVKKAIAAAKSISTKLTSAWSKMTKDALSAMDKQIANWVSPAAKLLAKMQKQDETKSVTGAVSDAQAALDAANGMSGTATPTTQTAEEAQLAQMQAEDQVKSLNDAILQAQADGDAEQLAQAQRALAEYNLQQTIAAQQATAQAAADNAQAASDKQTAILAAQQQLADAQRALTEFNLGVDDATQTAEHAAAMKKAEEQFKEKLGQLEVQLLKEHATRKVALKKMKALYAKYGVPYNAGEVSAAAALIVAAVGAAMKKTGKSAKKMASGGIVTSPTYALIGESGPEAVIPLGQMRGGGSSINITVPLSMVGASPREAAVMIRDELVRMVRTGAAPNALGGLA